MKIMQITELTGFSDKKFAKHNAKAQEIIAFGLEGYDHRIGGLAIEVQLDESKLAKKKYYIGHEVIAFGSLEVWI